MIPKPIRLSIDLSYSQAVAIFYQLEKSLSKAKKSRRDDRVTEELTAFQKWKKETGNP